MPSTCVLSLCLLLAINVVKGQNPEEGFESLHTSSPDELNKVLLTFNDRKAPNWLNGTLMRVGPGLFDIQGPTKSYVTNSLDGFSKVAQWDILGNGSICFSTKFINSTYLMESLAKKKFTSNIFWNAPFPALTNEEKERSKEVGIDNMVINVVDFLDSSTNTKFLAATSDFWSFYELSLDEVVANRKLMPTISDAGQASEESPRFLRLLATAHPLPELNTGNKINLLIQAALNPGEKNIFRLVRINNLQQTHVIASWEVPEVSYIHSFGLSEKYAAIWMNPLILNTTCMVNNTGNCYTWRTENDTVTLYVVNLQTGNVVTIPVPKAFILHHINSYDVSNDEMVLDLAAHDHSNNVFDRYDISKVKNSVSRKSIEPRPNLKRLRVTLSSRSATLTSIPSPTPTSAIASTLDYPVINKAHLSRTYCYVYGIAHKIDGKYFGSMGVAKKDVCTDDGRHADALFQKPGWYPHEPTFVPSPNPSAEDDGILLVPYTSGQDKLTHLVVLNATDLKLIDIAYGRVNIPASEHGAYYPYL